MAREIQLLQESNDQQSSQLREFREQISRCIQERDQFRNDTQELHKNKKTIEKQYAFDKISNKEREVKLQKQAQQLIKEQNELKDEILNLRMTCKQLNADKEKSKARIQKLLQKKGKFDSGFKQCKNCNKEYNEKENFNWSCRTH